MASHDDATLEHVDEAVEQGIDVAEFPTTIEAARASHEAGLAVLMGAPNVVRGGSHSGNISAREPGRRRHPRHPELGLHAVQPDAGGVQAHRGRERHRAARGGAAGQQASGGGGRGSAIAARSPSAGAPIWCGSRWSTAGRWCAPCGAKAGASPRRSAPSGRPGSG